VSTVEQSLADVETVDSTPHITPQDFSFEEFLNGVRPTRRSVLLYPHAELIARLDQIANQIDAAPEDRNVDDLIDEFERVKAQFHTGVWFTVEKRSSEWVEKFRVDTEKRLGMKRTRSDEDSEPELATRDLATISLHQLAEQIVTPSGVTVAQLQKLMDTNEGELNKLVFAMIEVNTKLAQAAEVLNKDFSRRRSGSQ
jgi:hypothetical protein